MHKGPESEVRFESWTGTVQSAAVPDALVDISRTKDAGGLHVGSGKHLSSAVVEMQPQGVPMSKHF